MQQSCFLNSLMLQLDFQTLPTPALRCEALLLSESLPSTRIIRLLHKNLLNRKNIQSLMGIVRYRKEGVILLLGLQTKVCAPLKLYFKPC